MPTPNPMTEDRGVYVNIVGFTEESHTSRIKIGTSRYGWIRAGFDLPHFYNSMLPRPRCFDKTTFNELRPGFRLVQLLSGSGGPNPYAKDVRSCTHPPGWIQLRISDFKAHRITHSAYCWNFFPPESAEDNFLIKHLHEADSAEYGRFVKYHDALEKIPPRWRER